MHSTKPIISALNPSLICTDVWEKSMYIIHQGRSFLYYYIEIIRTIIHVKEHQYRVSVVVDGL